MRAVCGGRAGGGFGNRVNVAHARRGCWGGLSRSYPEVRHEASYVAATVVAAVSCLSGLVGNGRRGRAGAVDDAAADVRRPAARRQRGGRIVRAADHRGADQRRHRRPVREHAAAADVPQPIRATASRGCTRCTPGPGTKADGFAYWNGEQKIVGEVFERGVARQVYQNVTRRRRDPGLLEETGDGVFSFAVSPIEPGERKRVEVSYGQWLSRHVVDRRAARAGDPPGQRRHRDDLGRARAARDLVADARGGRAAPEQRALPGALAQGEGATRRSWCCATRSPTSRWTPAGYAHHDKDQDTYFTLTLAAPELPASATMAKDVTLVIDRSGSMAGEAIRQARAACIDIVKRLRSDDHLNIILFDHSVEKLFAEPRPVTRGDPAAGDRVPRDDGRRRRDRSRGALEPALASQASGNRPRVVLFFTDGQSDVPPVLTAMQNDKRDVRVFTVGFGDDVNKSLLVAAGGAQARAVHVHPRRRRTSSARCRCCTGRSTRRCWSTCRWRRRAAP